jgi:hypothetical protein
MKNFITKKLFFVFALLIAVGAGIYVVAADHGDPPSLATDQQYDISDVYVFRSQEDTNNLVFYSGLENFLTSGQNPGFNPNSMLEFNIDTDNNNVEDLVIQCIYENNQVTVYGPVAPSQVGTSSTLMTSGTKTEGALNTVITNGGIKVYAGLRDDPFFFDLNQFLAIIGGTATQFNDPGTDTFAGTNVLATIVEVPKSMLGSGASINVWAESKRKN